MSYENLDLLISKSKSSRTYFLSLPISLQMTLHEQGEFIHTAFDLRRQVKAVEEYQRLSSLDIMNSNFKS